MKLIVESLWCELEKRWPADRKVFVALLVIASAGLTFIGLSLQMQAGATMQIDNQILLSLRKKDNTSQLIGPTWLLPVVQDISALGGAPVIVILSLLVVLYFAFSKRWRILTFFLSSVCGGTLMMLLLKEFFQRPRPSTVSFLVPCMHTAFPSGHSMISAIVYLTLAALLARAVKRLRLKLYFMASAFFLTFLIGLSRICLGVHYPSDVLAGWCCGLTWSSASYLLAYSLQRRGVIEEETNPAPDAQSA